MKWSINASQKDIKLTTVSNDTASIAGMVDGTQKACHTKPKAPHKSKQQIDEEGDNIRSNERVLVSDSPIHNMVLAFAFFKKSVFIDVSLLHEHILDTKCMKCLNFFHFIILTTKISLVFIHLNENEKKIIKTNNRKTYIKTQTYIRHLFTIIFALSSSFFSSSLSYYPPISIYRTYKRI